MATEAFFSNRNKLCKDGNHLAKRDCISELPDEVLISILSCLTLKEAAKTSILSRRWEKLWTFTTGILDFDGLETLLRLQWLEIEPLEYQRAEYTDWVNRILKLHQGHSIDEFRVLFDLESSSSQDINNWIEFALLKGVKRLELDLRSWVREHYNEKFTFPAIDKLNFFAKQKMGSSGISCFRPLTSIILKDVNISQEVIDYFLFNCPFLEHLSLTGSYGLAHIKVSGDPMLKLKYLEISLSRDSDIPIIEISAPNLISFSSDGPEIILLINNAPRLSELSLRSTCYRRFMEEIWQHTSCLSQLQTLSVKLFNNAWVPPHFPEFKNLTRLKIDVFTSDYHSLHWINSFIVSCPALRELAIHVSIYYLPESFIDALEKKRKRVMQEVRNIECRHEGLKVVELRGFHGHRTHVELALSLLETAVSLEKIIVDSRLPVRRHYNLPFDYVEPHERTRAAIESALQLKEKLPAGATLVML